ncbi:hypothetical protein NG799_11810 [Laspinema sp. D1]|uniref:Uncharacterized protein n=1 Tax=Laspinema palackyanum D2a TaxID=2953684 RepID=A0ABT2MR65_9CYAN|nr:hypothetical protein [Laspinema sp. D2a]
MFTSDSSQWFALRLNRSASRNSDRRRHLGSGEFFSLPTPTSGRAID